MAETALDRIGTIHFGPDRVGIVARALNMYAHPQDRTMEFHRFYNAPIRNETPDRQFSHMDDARVAFRVSFLLSELFELLDKGLGINVKVLFIPQDSHNFAGWDTGMNDASLCKAIHSCLAIIPDKRRNLIEVVDALGDLNVVVNGFAIELGVDMNAIDREIMASNFTKPDEDGQPIIGNGINGPEGKVLKGPNYMEPNIEAVIYGTNS